MTTETETQRSNRDNAILATLANPLSPDWGDSRDGFTATILDNSGLIAVSYCTGTINGLPTMSGAFAGIRGFKNLTKLDSGESIAYTQQGKAFLEANA